MAELILVLMVIYVTWSTAHRCVPGGAVPDPDPLHVDVLAYHIGNGWFGGMLPLLRRPSWQGREHLLRLWYPIIVSIMTVVIGLLFVREPKHVKIRDETF